MELAGLYIVSIDHMKAVVRNTAPLTVNRFCIVWQLCMGARGAQPPQTAGSGPAGQGTFALTITTASEGLFGIGGAGQGSVASPRSR